MPTFAYKSLSSTGEIQSGELSAADRGDAVRQLLSRGLTAMSLDETEGAGRAVRSAPKPKPRPADAATGSRTTGDLAARVSRARTRRPSLNRSDMASLVRELATAIEAGLPLMQSLKVVRRQAHGKALPVILDHLIDRVEAGDPLHSAARQYGPPFDNMMIGMLSAADASGEMSNVLHQLADLLERQVELRREVLGATIYPLVVATLIVCSVVVLVTVLIPRLIEPLAGGMNLPWPTKLLLGIASFFSSYWLYILLAIGLAVIGWRMWSNVPLNRLRIDRTVLRIPVLGQLLRDVAVARFTRTLGTLTSAGLPILDALRITQNTLGNTALIEAVKGVQEQVTAGKPLAEPLERSGLFPPLLIQVVNLGERSGRLEKMLLHSATAFDRRVNNSIKIFTKALPPILLVAMATMGGFVLAAILLPLLELQSMVQ